eukprot:1147929-Pelagomonas_calceolata.AAC.5
MESSPTCARVRITHSCAHMQVTEPPLASFIFLKVQGKLVEYLVRTVLCAGQCSLYCQGQHGILAWQRAVLYPCTANGSMVSLCGKEQCYILALQMAAWHP